MGTDSLRNLVPFGTLVGTDSLWVQIACESSMKMICEDAAVQRIINLVDEIMPGLGKTCVLTFSGLF